MVRQCPLSAKCQLVPGDRFAVDELLARVEVTGLFQLAELGAEIAVGFVEQLPESTEGEPSVPRQEHGGGHARPVLQEWIEAGQDIPTSRRRPVRPSCHVRARNAALR